uniref:Uncharacterized protein n=1 Tax=Magallana gigas TaxID=29159 RepID=A0A8W8MJS6_MAGGI
MTFKKYVVVAIFSDFLQGDVHFSRVNAKVKELTDELHHLIERYRVCVECNVADVDLHFTRLPTYGAEIEDRTELARRLRQHLNVYTMDQVVAELAVPLIIALIHKL